jgi:YVTN family beta-propeller protein
VYSAPAGTQAAGPDKIHPADSILPNGRIAAPAGASAFVGSNPLGFALSPDGTYAVISNDGAPPHSSLAVVNVKTMHVASEYQDPSAAFFMGVGVVRDPSDPSRTLVLVSDGAAGAVRVFDMDSAGQLTPEAPTIALPQTGGRHAFPADIAISPSGRIAYVADNVGDSVVAIDIASRSVLRSLPVGDFPLHVSVSSRAILAAGTGVSAYAPAVPPATRPQFAAPAFDPSKSSALTVYETAGDQVGDPATVRMDGAPDGTDIVGGAQPGATVLSRNGELAYVALANVDRIAIVALGPEPRVVRGLDLRLYPGAPYGAEPSAEALSPNGKRLYVALAGLNAVAVLDAQRTTRYRYGLIPTAWYPSALALSHDGRYLYVLNSKGVNGWGILQRVDLKRTNLVRATLDSLRYNRTPAIAKANPVIPPLRSEKRSESIDHVVYIEMAPGSFDATFGDLKDDAGNAHGDGDPTQAIYPESVTPNLHALARSYALADNFYASDQDPDIAKEFAAAGEATLYQQLISAAGSARTPFDDHGDDPEDYARAGYLFNALARADISFRDYGGLLRLSGYDGSQYDLNVPALAALNGNVDLDYAGWDPKVTDSQRAEEFVRDMQRYVQSDSMPGFVYVSLPGEAGTPGATDADRAVGMIVDFLSHTPHWSSTAVFIAPQGAASSDHVNALRTYALVVSPLARRGYVGDEHVGMASLLKTEEEIFGLPPLTLNDLLASDFADFFTDAASPEPYQVR